MGSILGNNIKLSLFGESHANIMGVTIDNIKPGVLVDTRIIQEELYKRRPKDTMSTARIEEDKFEIISGIFENRTTGAPLTILVYNNDFISKDYDKIKSIVRPSHADYSAYIKYLGFNDYRGGGHFSGRLTAPIVAVGAICKQLLNDCNISIYTHINSIGDVYDTNILDVILSNEVKLCLDDDFPVIDQQIKSKMQEQITLAKNSNDSIGGSIQVLIKGVRAGIGNPVFNSIESIISHAMFSIGGVKAIEFGKGIEMSKGRASNYNDQIAYINDEVKFLSNNNGGINGGISNGCDICFTVYFKPTPTIGLPMNTIDTSKKENVCVEFEGRHDPCIARRAVHVVSSLSAFTILDLISGNSYEY